MYRTIDDNAVEEKEGRTKKRGAGDEKVFQGIMH